MKLTDRLTRLETVAKRRARKFDRARFKDVCDRAVRFGDPEALAELAMMERDLPKERHITPEQNAAAIAAGLRADT